MEGLDHDGIDTLLCTEGNLDVSTCDAAGNAEVAEQRECHCAEEEPPACVLSQFEGLDDAASDALLCGTAADATLDTSTCSAEELAEIQEHQGEHCGEIEGALSATIVLALTESDVGSAGTPERTAFETSFKTDLAASIDGVSADQVIITGITVGSVSVDFIIVPGSDGAPITADAVSAAIESGVQIAGATPVLVTDDTTDDTADATPPAVASPPPPPVPVRSVPASNGKLDAVATLALIAAAGVMTLV
jgi:hypothetical protein